MSLKGKAAIVTGSTSGIGLGIANALASDGCDIVLNGLGSERDTAQAIAEVREPGAWFAGMAPCPGNTKRFTMAARSSATAPSASRVRGYFSHKSHGLTRPSSASPAASTSWTGLGRLDALSIIPTAAC